MRRSILLTHITQPSNKWYADLKGFYNIDWLPLADFDFFQARLNDLKIDAVVLSSPTSVRHYFHLFDANHHKRKFYFVGRNSKHLFFELLNHSNSPSEPDCFVSNASSMLSLFNTFDECFRDPRKTFLWLGSCAGIKKHYKNIKKYSGMKPFATHYNWPRYYFTYQEQALLEQADFITISSHSAALAYRSLALNNNCSASIILSHQRLKKYVVDVSNQIFIGSWKEILVKHR